jgi:hypothetical protein
VRQGERGRKRGRKSLFWLLSSLMTLLFSGSLVVPALVANASVTPRVSAAGTLELCKSSANGMAGRAFQFSIDGGAAVTVNGGACTGPMLVASGAHTIVEAPTAGLFVKAIKANRVNSKDLATGTVSVRVKSGTTAADETLVTYVNARNASVGLKICKQSPDTALQGKLFSFTENGGPAFSVAAGPVGAPICGPVQAYPLDTIVNVAELASTGTHVSGITVSDGRGSNVNTAARTVSATIGAGVTIVTYTNTENTPVDNGYIEVCKSAWDPFVSGSFDFTITDSAGKVSTQSVLVGQCTAPLLVAAGNVSVAETARAPYYVADIEVFPFDRLVTSNLANRTVTVTVPKGDSSTETVVDFQNATNVGFFKVCKTLTANSSALAGRTFVFTVVDAAGQHTDSVVAGAAGTTACVIDFDAVPIGSHVSITEQGTPNVQNIGVSVSPASNNAGSSVPTANLKIGSGITTATFTNEAFGTIEVCKDAADPSTATQTFQFSVNGGVPISVHAGGCSMPISVPAGTATVAEIGKNNFHLVSVTALGPTGSSRVQSGTNPVTVVTPFGGVENETLVTFTNAVNTGQFKICKASSEPTLQTTTFNFTSSYTVNGVTTTGTAALTPGTCSALSGSIPVVDPNGLPIAITVSEGAMATVAVSNIAVQNGSLVTSSLANRTATFNTFQGFSQITFTNVRTQILG